MDIRYFEFLDRLKRGDESEIRLRGETDNHTRLLTGELGVQIPPGAQIPPHLLRGAENDDAEKAARRAAMIKAWTKAEEQGLFEVAEHLSGSGAWLGKTGS